MIDIKDGIPYIGGKRVCLVCKDENFILCDEDDVDDVKKDLSGGFNITKDILQSITIMLLQRIVDNKGQLDFSLQVDDELYIDLTATLFKDITKQKLVQ